jgi:hypothetical protein
MKMRSSLKGCAVSVALLVGFSLLMSPAGLSAQAECSKCKDSGEVGGTETCEPDQGSSGGVCRIGPSGNCTDWPSSCVPPITMLDTPFGADPITFVLAMATWALTPENRIAFLEEPCALSDRALALLFGDALGPPTDRQAAEEGRIWFEPRVAVDRNSDAG